MVTKHCRCNRTPSCFYRTADFTVAHAYLAAQYCLLEGDEIRASETHLITRGAGGVGLAMSDLGRLRPR